jgi:hypothetical protein
MAHPNTFARAVRTALSGHSTRSAQQHPRRLPRWLLVHHEPLVGSETVLKKSEVPAQGFEPWTIGLKDRCSAKLSYAGCQ